MSGRSLPLPHGDPCPFCERPMWPDQRLQVDHVIPCAIGGADGPVRWAHGRCNEQAGGRFGNRTRSRLKDRWLERWS